MAVTTPLTNHYQQDLPGDHGYIGHGQQYIFLGSVSLVMNYDHSTGLDPWVSCSIH
jgi:hypothetical protein